MRKLRAVSLFALGILVWALVFAGCSGSSAITVALSPASGQSVSPGQTVTVIATLTNDKNNQGVTWTLTGPGSLSGNTTTSVVYTAPTSISVSATATITATSVANTSVTATESITLTAVLSIITTSLPAGTLGVPYDSFINAAGAPAPFTWTVKSGSLPPGLTFQASSTSTSAEITGTPTVLGTSNFTVQVTDSSDASVTQALSITINRPPPLSVATASLPDGTVNVGYSQTLQASSGVQPYTWSLIGGALPFGLSLASNGAISGTPVATGTSNFTVEVKDSSSPQQTASANLSITIQPGITDNSRLNGNYAFSVRGFDPNGLFVAAGSFVADGAGNISAGVMDINDTGSAPTNPTFTGTYSIDQNGLGQLSFNVSGGSSRVFALSMMSNGNANIIEFDDSTGGGTRNSGVLLRQQSPPFSTSELTGGYAFGFAGIDSSKNRFAEAGDVQADGAGHFTAGILDSDDSVTGVSSDVAFTGTYAVTSSNNGRGLATIGTSSYSFYVVKANELLFVEIDPFVPGGTNPLLSGTMLSQSNNGSFTDASFNGSSVFEVTALEASGTITQSQIGLFTGNGAGSFSMTSDQNTGGTLTAQPLVGTGSYSVAPDGRTTSTLLSGSGFQNTTPTSPQPVFYVVSDNQAFIIGADSAVSFGFMTAQSAFSLGGTYAGGSLAPVDTSVSNVVSVAIAGSNTLNVTSDVSNNTGLSTQNQISEATTPPDVHGRVSVTLPNSSTVVGVLYLVSPTEFYSLSADTTARVDIFQQ